MLVLIRRNAMRVHCFIAAIFLAPCCGCRAVSENAFFIRNAELEDAHYLELLDKRSTDERAIDRSQHGVFVHRVKVGHGTVYGFRRFDAGDHLTIDDEGFLKVTVWLRDPQAKTATTINVTDAQNVVVVYSRGGSAWPEKTCSGYLTSGSVTFEPHGDTVQVKVHGQLQPSGNRDVWKRCRAEVIDIEFRAKQMRLDQLTPWLGTAGKHIYDETYR